MREDLSQPFRVHVISCIYGPCETPRQAAADQEATEKGRMPLGSKDPGEQLCMRIQECPTSSKTVLHTFAASSSLILEPLIKSRVTPYPVSFQEAVAKSVCFRCLYIVSSRWQGPPDFRV